MTKLSLTLGVLVIGVFSMASAEEKKMGPYKLIIEGVNPRSKEGDHVSYESVVFPLDKNKPDDKRTNITFFFKRDIAPIGASLTIYLDKDKNKGKNWNKEGTCNITKVCESDGFEHFLECFEPKAKFDKESCGIMKGESSIFSWTIDVDLHKALEHITYGYYKINVCLSDNYDMQSQQMDFSECFLEFEVTADIVDAAKKEKKKCKKDDKDCKKKKKKDKNKDKEEEEKEKEDEDENEEKKEEK